MPQLKPFNFREWIDRHRDALKPPVCNKQVFREAELIVMVVGGPNSRKDYHDDPGEELFYQLEGDMLLKTMQNGQPVDIPIREGEIFLLPAGLPHSPQRYADTVGVVVERRREPDEKDGFLWFCDNCHHRLYDEYLHVHDIENQLPPVFERFYADAANRTCDRCGSIMPAPGES
ncbi:3-hydroxyanthranilate 3,4-dioxygenase [soil metagenome]